MTYEKINYPDGGAYIKLNDPENPKITYKINSYEDLFLLKSLKDAFESSGVMEGVEITIPCMFQQQHDRRFNSNESFELKLVCDFINSCNFSKVNVFHPHSDVTAALLNKCKVIDNSEYIRIVLSKIDTDNLILLSSDAGGFKPLIKLADIIEWKNETYAASKSRDPHTHKLTQVIDRQDFQGKDILIIDDLCVYGGTFIGLAKMLKERNVGKIYLAVSHITVKNPNKELEKYYDKVFTTNSKYEEYDLSNLELIKIF